MTTKLWTPVTVGRMRLPHRLAMAPMTRDRALPDGTPGPSAATYYSQRASMGLLITEGTQPSDDGQGYLSTPGIYTPAHVNGWRRVVDAVHDAGGHLVIQLMHVGRMSHPDNTPHHRQPVGPSAITPAAQMHTPTGMKDIPQPRAFRQACKLDPELPEAHLWLGRVSAGVVPYGWSDNPAADLREGMDAAVKSVQLDERNPYTRYALAIVSVFADRFEQSISAARKAIEISPNFALGHLVLGMSLLFSGRASEAIAPLEYGLRLSPYDPQNFVWFNTLALARLFSGRAEAGLGLCKCGRIGGPVWKCSPAAMLRLENGTKRDAVPNRWLALQNSLATY